MMSNFGTNFRAPRVDVHDFTMIPRADIPRSRIRMPHNNKTTMNASALLPIYLQEVIPGDSFHGTMTAFVRMSTPIVPIMDNLDLETFFFFVPNRILWVHWVNFMGEQANPGDSTSYTIPQVVSPTGGFAVNSIYDHFGLPCVGQTLAGNTISVSALPLRAYNRIFNDWFRDENLINSVPVDTGDGPDLSTDYVSQLACKRHDYFTSCLPWTQKGGTPILPLQGTAVVKTSASVQYAPGVSGTALWMNQLTAGNPALASPILMGSGFGGTAAVQVGSNVGSGTAAPLYPSNLYADLSTATQTTINALRLAFQTQKLLERDARGGTRYVEKVLAHYGVRMPDFRAQRPEYIGGGKTPITITPVPQTSQTGLTGGSTPIGTLAAAGTAIARHSFRYSATEHGHIVGLGVIRQTMGYQQGIHRMWKRSTLYDFYFPVFQALGEQSVFNYEIYSDGSANDTNTFGFQERWAEMRYHPSTVCGVFRSTSPTPIDYWHLVEKFAALPTLNQTFIGDSTQFQVNRVTALGAAGQQQQFLADMFFDVTAARPMPVYSVPGNIDHF